MGVARVGARAQARRAGLLGESAVTPAEHDLAMLPSSPAKRARVRFPEVDGTVIYRDVDHNRLFGVAPTACPDDAR